MKRIVTSVAGFVCILIGALWILQGANIVGGSVMSGESQWLVIGIVLAAIGVVLLWWGNRRPPAGR